ncbi:MAG: hypothetical protein RLZZ303_3201, partial [Candidatus Hydrogenedentota bacterium]
MSDDPKDPGGLPEDFDLFGMEPLPAEEEDSLLAGLADDKRLGSGVPESQRLSEVDFIAMSGITRPMPKAKPAPAAPQQSDEESELLISFAEPGVRDVDENESTEPLARGAVALPPEDDGPDLEAGEDPYAPVTPNAAEEDAPETAYFVSLEDEAGHEPEGLEEADADETDEERELPLEVPGTLPHDTPMDGGEAPEAIEEESVDFIEEHIEPSETLSELAPPAEDFTVLLEAIDSEETVDLPPADAADEDTSAAEQDSAVELVKPAPPASAARWKLEEA